MRRRMMAIAGVGALIVLPQCTGKMDEANRQWVLQMTERVRAGGTIAYAYPPTPPGTPESDHPPWVIEATAAIRESTGIEIERDVFGANGKSCVNATLTGPKGKRPLAVVIQHHGDADSYADPVKNVAVIISTTNRCTCSGRTSATATCRLQ